MNEEDALPLLCPEHWPTAERDARELLSVLGAHPRARPPRAVVLMLLDYHRDEGIPETVMEALAIAMEVADYGRAQLRRALLRRGREAGRTVKEVAAEQGIDPRSARSRPAPKTRPRNADLFDRVLAHGLANGARLAVAQALGLVGEDGRWRTRVLNDARRFWRSDVLFAEAAKAEGATRARRADALSSAVKDGDIQALRDALAQARQAIVEGGGDPSLIDELTDFELHARERADHWNALHPHAEHPREPKRVDNRRAWADLARRDVTNRILNTQALDAADIVKKLRNTKRISAEVGWVEVWMKRPAWEGAVLSHTVWETRTLRAK